MPNFDDSKFNRAQERFDDQEPPEDDLPRPEADMRIEMVDPLGHDLTECESGEVPAKSIALTYAFAIRHEPATADFGPANEAIRERFKTTKNPNGLKALAKIKNLAWDYVSGRKSP